MNQPERFEQYILGADETKVSYKPDTKATNAGTYVIRKEDSTLGNVVRFELLHDKRVLFAGYKQPHPLLPEIEIKVKTNGSVPPKKVMLDACTKLNAQLTKLNENFCKALTLAQHR